MKPISCSERAERPLWGQLGAGLAGHFERRCGARVQALLWSRLGRRLYSYGGRRLWDKARSLHKELL